MTEQDYLSAYDPSQFPGLAVAVDVVLLTFDAGLMILLSKRREHPARDRFALPGVFVAPDEDLDRAAARAISSKLGVEVAAYQFRAFGQVDRDPRMRVISIGYLALAPIEAVRPALDETHQLWPVEDRFARDPHGRQTTLPFDHADIIAAAITYLREHLDSTDIAFGLLPPVFSLRQLQEVHEAVRGVAANKPAFRKRLLDTGKLEPTGESEAGNKFRPAQLYRLRGGARG